jgi:hypothetical protein
MLANTYIWANMSTPDASTATRALVLRFGRHYIDLHIRYSADSWFCRRIEPRIEGPRYCVAY